MEMYKTKIKKQHRDTFKWFWADTGDEEFDVILTMGDMSLLYYEDTGLLLDIYNSKLEHFKSVQGHAIYVEAKNLDYADRFDLHGEYRIIDFITKDNSVNKKTVPALLVVENKNKERRTMLPSRLHVTRIE
jgi:hypothetical protein